MEQVESIPFSGLIAGILLYKRSCTSFEIAIVLSKLGEYGIIVDDENDDLSIISCCVEMDKNYGFCLKHGLNYNSVLLSGVVVSDFLRIHTREEVLALISRSIEDFYSQKRMMTQVPVVKNKKENFMFSLFKPKILSRKKYEGNNFN